jgi:hypothetical protein
MKKVIVIAVLMSMLAGAVYAQGLPSPWSESAQSAATQGRYRSTMDNFIRPDAFSGVSFEKFFAMGGFQSAGNAQLGYATKLGSTYLGIAYAGNFWSNVTDRSYTETYVDGITSRAGSGKNFKVYTPGIETINTPATFWAGGSPANLLAVLIGLENMGIRIAINTTYETFSDSDVRGGPYLLDGSDPDPNNWVYYNLYFKNVEASTGHITPQFAWALTKDLTSDGIRPWATLGLGFIRDNAQADVYGVSGTQIAYSRNYFEPVLDTGLGGYNIKRWEGGFRLSTDLDYQLAIRVYNNDYSYNDGYSNRTGSVSGTWTGTVLTERSYMQNTLTPSLSGQWSGDTLALRFKLNLPFTFTSESATGLTPTAAKLKHGEDSSTFAFVFDPNIRLAMQWKALSKLTVNAGARVNLASIRTVKKTYTTYTNGIYASSGTDSSTNFGAASQATPATGTTASTRNASNNVTLGVSFFPTENMTIEASSGIGANNALSVFSDTGVFNFTNIGVSLKF